MLTGLLENNFLIFVDFHFLVLKILSRKQSNFSCPIHLLKVFYRTTDLLVKNGLNRTSDSENYLFTVTEL